MALEFAVLGPLEVRSGGNRLEIGGARRRALLAYLLVSAGLPQSVDRVVDVLWSESAPPTTQADTGPRPSALELGRRARGCKRPRSALPARWRSGTVDYEVT